MKVLVTGVKGQLGYDVMKALVWMWMKWISQTELLLSV